MTDDDAATLQFSLRISSRFLRRVAVVQRRLDNGMRGALDTGDGDGMPKGVSRGAIVRAAAQRGLKLMEAELGVEEQKADGAE